MLDTEQSRREFLASWMSQATGQEFWDSDGEVELLLGEVTRSSAVYVLSEWLLQRQVCDTEQARALALEADDVISGWN